MPMDSILIQQLEVETIIGVHAWEQHAPRRLVMDVEMGFDIRPAAASDHLREAVDYKSVSDEMLALSRARRCQLIETLAEALAKMLFEHFQISTLKLTIFKPGAVPEAKTVAVRIERKREDYAVCGR